MSDGLNLLSQIAALQQKIVDKSRRTELEAAIILMRLNLTAGQTVEVYYAGKKDPPAFYEATITRVGRKGFDYVFTDNQAGRTLFKHLHARWRFPLNDESMHYNAENMLLVTHPEALKYE